MLQRTLVVMAISSGSVAAQSDSTPSLAVTPRWATEQFVSSRSALALDLSRPLASPNERLALIVGSLDVSAMVQVRGLGARYRPTAARLPAGESEVVAYLVRGPRDWTEVGRFPLKVRSRIGLDAGRATPSIDLSGSGMVREHLADGESDLGDRDGRELTVRMGFEGRGARGGWEIGTQANALGATAQAQRLRWNDLNSDAPAVDLSDYRVQLQRGGMRLTIGNSTVGSNRHLLNGFTSRGFAAAVPLGSFASVQAAVMNGTDVVGWSNPLGLEQPAHRIGTANLALELLPGRPGALRVDVSGINGSVLPQSSFNQGAATDAEESHGYGVQLGISDASQRVRLSGGVARSRFVNPADALLSGDSNLVAVRPTTRTARYGELAVVLLQSLTITPAVRADLGATVRHERVDPLYRSVAASVQPDAESNALDISGSIGALALQGMLGMSRDNLGKLASVLTTRSRSDGFSAALPIGALLRVNGAWFWPTVTVSTQRDHQYGEGVPTNAEFSATHVPDQATDNISASSTWTAAGWSVVYRWNQSFQDNRQVGREVADFRATVQGVSLSIASSERLTGSLDLGRERQRSVESGTLQRLQRVGATLQWQPFGALALSGAASHSRAVDPFAGQKTRNSEFQGEVSQGFNLYRRLDSPQQGRLFLRYARTRAAVFPFQPGSLLVPRLAWSLSAGGSFRIY